MQQELAKKVAATKLVYIKILKFLMIYFSLVFLLHFLNRLVNF